MEWLNYLSHSVIGVKKEKSAKRKVTVHSWAESFGPSVSKVPRYGKSCMYLLEDNICLRFV
jgi:hypothetical protein